MADEMRITQVELAVETDRVDAALRALSRLGWRVTTLSGHHRLGETGLDETAIHVEATLPAGDRTLLNGSRDELDGAGVRFRLLVHSTIDPAAEWLRVVVDGVAQVPPLRVGAMGDRIWQLEVIAARLGVDVTRLSIDPAGDPFSSGPWNDT